MDWAWRMLLRLGQPCVFAQSCFCDRTSDDMKLGLSSYHLQGLFTWLFVLTMLVSVPWMPRYTGLCAALQALQVGLICLLSSEFAVTSVIWKQTWWIHVCVFYDVLLSGRCVSVIYLVCLLKTGWDLWLHQVPAWGTWKNIWLFHVNPFKSLGLKPWMDILSSDSMSMPA